MGESNHQQYAANQVTKVLTDEKETLRLTNCLYKLRTGFWADDEFINAVFQPYRSTKTASIEDAICWLAIWEKILSGEILITSIEVGHQPKRNKEKLYHQTTLNNHLPEGFSAQVENGCQENDGYLQWNNLQCVQKLATSPWKRAWKCSLGNLAEGKCPLEIGYTEGSKTLEHLGFIWQRGAGAVARWPYHSDRIWILVNLDHGKHEFAVRETFGWDSEDCMSMPTSYTNLWSNLVAEDPDIKECCILPMIGHYHKPDEEDDIECECVIKPEHIQQVRELHPNVPDSELEAVTWLHAMLQSVERPDKSNPTD